MVVDLEGLQGGEYCRLKMITRAREIQGKLLFYFCNGMENQKFLHVLIL